MWQWIALSALLLAVIVFYSRIYQSIAREGAENAMYVEGPALLETLKQLLEDIHDATYNGLALPNALYDDLRIWVIRSTKPLPLVRHPHRPQVAPLSQYHAAMGRINSGESILATIVQRRTDGRLKLPTTLDRRLDQYVARRSRRFAPHTLPTSLFD